MSQTALHPVLKWAQRKERVFLELQLRDIQDEKVDLTAKGISFSGKSSGQLYEFNLEFFEEVAPEVLMRD
jgi:prostaglandin-E synthase